MKTAKKIIPSLCLVLIICLASGVGLVEKKASPTAAKVVSSPKIIIDAGHCGLTNTID